MISFAHFQVFHLTSISQMVRLAAIKCPHVGRTEVGLKLLSGCLDVRWCVLGVAKTLGTNWEKLSMHFLIKETLLYNLDYPLLELSQ